MKHRSKRWSNAGFLHLVKQYTCAESNLCAFFFFLIFFANHMSCFPLPRDVRFHPTRVRKIGLSALLASTALGALRCKKKKKVIKRSNFTTSSMCNYFIVLLFFFLFFTRFSTMRKKKKADFSFSIHDIKMSFALMG